MQNRSSLYLRGLAVVILSVTSCTYEANTEVSLDGQIPLTFKLNGSGHQRYFVISEIPLENQVPVANRDSSKNIRIWKILPKQGTPDIAWDWPPVKYGEVPAGFTQEIPAQGEPPHLVDGRVYAAGGPAYGAQGGEVWFTIRDGKSVVVAKPGGH